MARIRCKTVMEGPGPHETIVSINTKEGREEEVIVPRTMIVNGTLEVGRIGAQANTVLIELPINLHRETGDFGCTMTF